MDPRTNTGTCTKQECPFCKPKECCGDGHKHYVLNSENLEGVCTRHSDDCTPICVPTGDGKPGQRRVCSKGCNRVLKVANPEAPAGATAESELFNMVVCQADKRVICAPHANSTLAKAGATGQCNSTATFKPRALCSFDVDVWNLGPTCIANTVHGDKHAQCTDDVGAMKALSEVKTKCTKPEGENNMQKHCQRLGMTF